MNQNPNNNPYGPNPNYPPQPNQSNPNYPPAPGTVYGGQPSTGPNPNYGQPPSGPNPNYGQYAPPPPVNPNDPTPNSNYGSSYAPPPPGPDLLAGPYDPTVFSQQSGASYPAYPTPSNPGYGTPVSNSGYGTPVSNPGYGTSPSNPGYNTPISSPNYGMPGSMPPTTPPVKKSNARTILLSVIALLVVVGGVLGFVFYNNHQNTVYHDATATAQTQLAQAQSTSTAQAQSRATASAQATATYIQTHYPFSSNLVLNDSLKDNSQATKYGWDVGTECTFTDGAYEATEKQANFILPCAAENTNFSNFTFEVQMTIKTGGTGAEGGVIFRANMNTYALYILFIDTDGNYSLDLRANSSGSSTRTLKSGQIPGFSTGFFQVHTIGIVANGSQITTYVDQNQIAKVTDATYSSGQIGVISDYGSSATTVAYNNAKVWQL